MYKEKSMSQIQRICTQCQASTPLDARYCTQCGYDFEEAQPLQRSQLPVLIGRAALPILAGAASLALRAAWKLLQSPTARSMAQQAFQHLTQPAARPPVKTYNPPATVEPQKPAQPPANQTKRRTTIRIRSTWAVGDANGVWRRGTTDQTIEVEE
jgi:hypothetical protein